MTSVHRVALLALLIALTATLTRAQDLSSYRDFQLGMDLNAVASQTGMNLTEAKTLHRRPALIQELWWSTAHGGPSPQTDPVREVVFSFCDGSLFRMVVTYDWHRTEGFTDEDMIEALSSEFGIAARPVATIIFVSSTRVYNQREKVIARWENSQYSYNLYHSSDPPDFGMLVFSKRLDSLAQTAIAKAIQLDNQEDLHRERERHK
jgi:hypothetical protein